MTTCKPGDLVATGPNKYGDVGVGQHETRQLSLLNLVRVA